MCKVMIMSGIKPENNKRAVAFIHAMAGPMSRANNDGLGYAAIDEQGNLFGERWFKNDDAFKHSKVIDVQKADIKLSALGSMVKESQLWTPTITNNYSSFGDINLNKLTAITLHTRMATSAKTPQNVHPFVDSEHDTSLIHNGVIRNVEDFKFTLSTCDSESILISYLRNKVASNAETIQAAANELAGYYACGVFSRDVTGARILDIFKGNGASLYAIWVEDLDTIVFSTSASDVKDVCEKLGYTVTKVMEVNDGYLARFNPLTGELLLTESFTPGKEYSLPKTTASNIITTSNIGGVCTPINASRFKPKNSISNSMIAYLMLKPTVHVFNSKEELEFETSHYLYGDTGTIM